MPTTRIVFAPDHTVDVDGRLQDVYKTLSDAMSESWYVSFPVKGTRIDINPQQVRCLEMVGDPAEHSPP